jgi:hypothetical protein
MNLMESVKKAKLRGVPLVGISTADQLATEGQLVELFTGASGIPIMRHDVVLGARGLNDDGQVAVQRCCSGQDAALVSQSPITWLSMLLGAPEKSVCIFHNVHRWLAENGASQALQNLRDEYKANQRMVILLGPSLQLPVEIVSDVMLFAEPLPDESTVKACIQGVGEEVGVSVPDDVLSKSAGALSGLPLFAVEQSSAMSYDKAGLSIDECWRRKKSSIEQVRGLRVLDNELTFEALGGCDGIKSFLTDYQSGPAAPKLYVFVDEIEKALGGARGDTSGVSQDALGVLLSAMSDFRWSGALFVGPAGCSKSYLSQCVSGEFRVPVVQFDPGSAKGSLVGESEGLIRGCVSSILAMGGADVFWLATSNGIESLPAELQRRFCWGPFFFDLPSVAERASIWGIWLSKFGLGGVADVPALVAASEGWSGANIMNACRMAWARRKPISECLGAVIPAAVQAREQVGRLRSAATGTWFSAQTGGVYTGQAVSSLPAVGKRSLSL